MKTIKDRSLYLVISEEYCAGRSPFEVAEKAIAGGVDIVQMREKKKSMQELVGIGRSIAALCREKGVMFIVNDYPMLAQRVGADGVHLGQEDMSRFPITMARDILGPGKKIGVSTTSLEQLRKANDSDADYIGFGPVFQTKLKLNPVGTEYIKDIIKIAQKPVFFIGGIDMSNIGEILDRGGRNIALIRAITEAEDIESSARTLKERLLET